MNMWLGIPIVLWVIFAIILHVVLSVVARCLFEVILTDRDIIHFEKGKTKDYYSFYFLFILFGIYIPGFNILFIIAELILLEIDNLKLMKFK